MTRCARFAIMVLALAGPLSAEGIARADDATSSEARVHFRAGLNLLQDPAGPRYEEAYVEFKRAYALVGAHKILANIALCAMKLERDAEAIDAFSRYLSAAEAAGETIDPEERQQIERDLTTLKAGMAQVTVESRPDGATIRDTRIVAHGPPTTNIYGPLHGRTTLGLRRGYHVVEARFPDGRSAAWQIEANGGEAHIFEAPPPEGRGAPTRVVDATAPVEERPVPRRVWISAAATLALGAGAAVTGLLAVDAKTRFDESNDGNNVGRAEDLRSSGQTLNLVSDVLLVATVLAGGVTAYLYLSRPILRRSTAGIRVRVGAVTGFF
jgi:hypothetical protein